jgi:alpha-L-fucosidase
MINANTGASPHGLPATGKAGKNPHCLTIVSAILLFPFISFADVDGTAPPDRPPQPPERVLKTDMGVTQLPDDKMKWILDAKFGMFIHWGLYSGPGQGEWLMENKAIWPDQYRKYASPESGDDYFDAADFHPDDWAQLAKDAGMKWMCLTTRHHEGFCLFDSPHPNAFTSEQTLHRDLVAEYVKAVRAAGLKVGIYYSPLSWRYPGYYDVTGQNMQWNRFGYKQDPSDKENARLMKEENYVNVKQLLTGYGKIDYIFWDGGWLAQKGTDADAAFFHEPGKYLDPQNQWPIPAKYQDLEDGTGKPLGIMGMVRKYQPDAITNLRYGWVGDMIEEEGSGETTGPIRNDVYQDKCMCIQGGPWGYSKQKQSGGGDPNYSCDDLVHYLVNAAVRNMTFLLNVTPDGHGVIPKSQQDRLREVGAWLAKTGDSIYGTRGGPWQPVDGKYGYTYKDSTVFAHLLKGYAGDTFQVPPMGSLKVEKVYDVYSGAPLNYQTADNGSLAITGLDRTSSPADTIIGVVYDQPIVDVWKD